MFNKSKIMRVFFCCFLLSVVFLVKGQERVENRNGIVNFLKQKIAVGEPLIAHVLVPLCDNVHQGIVPTSEAIGNGLDPDHNLYWMTSKGVKRYFRDLPDWKLETSLKDPTSLILERVVFTKTYSNGAKVVLVADAYRGDKMHECLNDYFNALSGNRKDSIVLEGNVIQIAADADLVAFNGHNGLMDESTVFKNAKAGSKPKDAVSISCASANFFRGYYLQTKSFPLVHTTNLLYPGAFILEGILNQWAMLGTEEDCKKAAGQAYYKHKPKSGPNGSQNLFNYGW